MRLERLAEARSSAGFGARLGLADLLQSAVQKSWINREAIVAGEFAHGLSHGIQSPFALRHQKNSQGADSGKLQTAGPFSSVSLVKQDQVGVSGFCSGKNLGFAEVEFVFQKQANRICRVYEFPNK